MPLQITVHASSLRRKRTLAELVAELHKLPAGGRLSRLFASLDLSYRDLTEGGQRVWRALGAHSGPHLTAGTAAAMLDCPTDEAVQLLDELVEANFADRFRGRFDLHSGGVEIPNEPAFYAYVVHDVLRDYAYHKATGQPAEYQSMVLRLLDYYWERVRPSVEVDRAWLQVERVCLVAALWLTEPTEHLTELARWVGHQLKSAGWYTEAEAADQLSLYLVRKTGNRAGEADALWSLAQAPLTRGDYDDATRKLHGSLAIYREIGNREGEARALQDLAALAEFLGHFDLAANHLHDALKIHQELGDRKGEFHVRRGFAQLTLVAHGEVDGAAKEFRKLYGISTELGDQRLQACALLDIAHVALLRGSVGRAAEAFNNAHKIYQAEGHRHGQANAQWGIGRVAMARGNHEQAAKHLQKAMAIYREIGDQEGEAKTQASLAEIAVAFGEFQQAETRFLSAYTIYREMNTVLGQARTLEGLAMVAMQTGNRAAACIRLRAALQILQTIRSPAELHIRQLMAECGCAPDGEM